MTAGRKTTTIKTTKAKTTTKKVASRTSKTPKSVAAAESTLASRESHFKRIQQEAYFLAENDGFAGDPTAYWLAAEANVLRGSR